jgi:hypothetical protein
MLRMMRALRSSSTVFRFRMTSLLLVLRCLLMAFTALVVLHLLITYESTYAWHGLIALALFGMLTLVQWMISTGTHCPLCMTPVLARRECSKHPRAKRLFGSHRLRVASTILFANRFTCPYCNERTAVKVRLHHPANVHPRI